MILAFATITPVYDNLLNSALYRTHTKLIIKDFREMEQLIKTLDSTFNKSTLKDFIEYLNNFPDTKNYILASDYCIHDKTKFNDTFSFVVFPKISNFLGYQDAIKDLFPVDLKKTNKINPQLEEVMKSGNVFVFNFIFPKTNKRILRHVTKDHVEYGIKKTIEMIDLWISNEPKNKHYIEEKKQFIILYEEQKRKSFNLNLFTNLMLVSTCAAYISHKIIKHSKGSNVCWFSDRDDMTTFCNGIIFNYYSIQHNGILRNDTDYRDNQNKLSIGTCENCEKCWYDPIIRLSDYFAGAYASLDYKNNKVTHDKEKYWDVINFSCANLSNIIIEQDPDYSKIQYHASRLVVQKIE